MSSLRRLCSVYGLSSILFNDNENSTYNNVSEAKRAAFTDVYLPLADKVDQRLGQFISDAEGINNENVTADRTSIEEIKANTNETGQALNSMSPLQSQRVMEVMTINEVRSMAGLPDIDGGDQLAGEGSTNVNASVNG